MQSARLTPPSSLRPLPRWRESRDSISFYHTFDITFFYQRGASDNPPSNKGDKIEEGLPCSAPRSRASRRDVPSARLEPGGSPHPGTRRRPPPRQGLRFARFGSLGIALRRFASLCIALPRFASLCIALHRFASLCIALHRFASLGMACGTWFTMPHALQGMAWQGMARHGKAWQGIGMARHGKAWPMLALLKPGPLPPARH